jgi:ferredoxin-nitrate reductase
MEQVVPPSGEAKPDWWWARQVAGAMGFKAGLAFDSAAEIFDEFARVTAGRPNDQSALSHPLLRAKGPQQWPYPALGRTSARRYEDGCFPTPTGRAWLFARPHVPPAEAPDARFPLVLTTGRVAGQWHTRTKTGAVPELIRQDPAPYVQMHPADAAALGLRDGQAVQVESRRGRATGALRVDPATPPGTVFMPMHWNELWAPGASCNEATTGVADRISCQPALKYCAVAVYARATAEAGPSDGTGRPREPAGARTADVVRLLRTT